MVPGRVDRFASESVDKVETVKTLRAKATVPYANRKWALWNCDGINLVTFRGFELHEKLLKG